MLVSPQNLINDEVAVLKRFGYTSIGDATSEWAGMWEMLRGDFATLRRSYVPHYAEMSPWPQEGARIYMRRRLLADQLFEECREIYSRLHLHGINTELVEAYSLAREAYEDAVMDFSRSREILEDVLCRTVDLVSAGRESL